jgi:hypothetical protein
VYITLGGEEAIMAYAHVYEGVRNEIRFWKVIGVPEDVRESKRVGGKQAMAVEEAVVGESVAILFCPSAKDVVILLVGYLSQISDEERGRGRRGKKTKRRADTGNDDEEEWPEQVKGQGGCEEEKRGEEGEGEREKERGECERHGGVGPWQPVASI